MCMMSIRDICQFPGMVTQYIMVPPARESMKPPVTQITTNPTEPTLHWVPAPMATEASSKRIRETDKSNTRRGPVDVGSLELLLLLETVEMTFPA